MAIEFVADRNSFATQELLQAMLGACGQVSDLIFSPGRLPQVQVHGKLLTVQAPKLRALTADETRRIASDLIGNNKQAITMLREQGSCDISYAIPGLSRFRVNVFIQRGSCAVIMRVIPTLLPSFRSLGLPAQLEEMAGMSEGIVVVAGPRGSGKSSTLAALLDRINAEQTCHIITIEDPIEFLHNHKKATVHQRELHSDTPSFAQGLRTALRQAPQIIFVGEIHDRETMQMALEAAETGHMVLTSINAIDAAQTVQRIVGVFSAAEQPMVRRQLSRTLRCIISQKLLPRCDGPGRTVAVEIFKVNARTMAHIESEDATGARLLEAVRNGAQDGMQSFDADVLRLLHAGSIDMDTAAAYLSDPYLLSQEVIQ